MIFTEGSGMSCSCDLCGTTEHGITIPCSEGASWNCDGYDERDCEDSAEVCEALYVAGWRANSTAQFCPECQRKHTRSELDQRELEAMEETP